MISTTIENVTKKEIKKRGKIVWYRTAYKKVEQSGLIISKREHPFMHMSLNDVETFIPFLKVLLFIFFK